MASEGFSPGQSLKLWLEAGEQTPELHVEAVPASSEAAELAGASKVLPPPASAT